MKTFEEFWAIFWADSIGRTTGALDAAFKEVARQAWEASKEATITETHALQEELDWELGKGSTFTG